MKSKRPSKKFDWKNNGPFKITQVVSFYAYRLELPKDWIEHDVFHVSLLRPAANNPLPGQAVLPPLADLDEDGYEAYPVERILDSRLFRGRTLQYLVKWTGYEQPQWEPWDNMAGAPVRLADYYTENPGRVGEDSWLESQNISDLKESALEITEDGSESDWDPNNNNPGEDYADVSLNAVDFKGLVGAFGPREGVLSELQRTTPLATPNPQHRPDNT